MEFLRQLATVEMFLSHLLYVSYLLPKSRIRPFLPANLAPATVTGDLLFLSLVVFRGKTVAAMRIPAIPFTFDQVNIRTYVIDPETGGPAVYFLNCGISSGPITTLYKLTSGMPVEHIPFRLSVEKGPFSEYLSYGAQGDWHGGFVIETEEVEPELKELSPFTAVEDAVSYLIDPLVGFYGSQALLRRLPVYHPPLIPRVCAVRKILFPYLQELGLVTGDELERPHSALLVPGTPFHIYLPPGRPRG
jgi:hypothetical protein